MNFYDQGTFKLSPDELAKFALIEEMRLLQQKFDRLYAFIQISMNRTHELTESGIWIKKRKRKKDERLRNKKHPKA